MSQLPENPYQAPSSDLREAVTDGGIHHFKRFSAWGVFGLSIITVGIYPVYWLVTRAEKINQIQDNQIQKAWLAGLIISTVLSFGAELWGQSDVAVVAALLVAIAYFVFYLVVLFKVLYRLEDIMNASSNIGHDLNGILAFFFSAIYLQYRVNKCIDEINSQSEVT